LSEVNPELLCEVHDPEQMGQLPASLDEGGYTAEQRAPVDPHDSDCHQPYLLAVRQDRNRR